MPAFGWSWITALAFGLVQLPLLARAPQTPDGAELVAAALSGGLLHAPGYPLQAWLDRAFVLLPFDNPSLALAVLSWLAQTAAVGVLLETLREAGCGWQERVFGSALFAFFPVTWYLGVQPERYALCSLLAIGCVYEAVVICKKERPGTSDALKAGLVYSLALAQHPMLLVLLPVQAALLERFRQRPRPWKAWLVWAGATLVPAGCLYLSLLLMSKGVVWPNWGHLSGLDDLMAFLLRADFANDRVRSLDTQVLFELARTYWSSFSVLGLAQFFGWVVVWRVGGRFLALGLAASLALGIYPILSTNASPDRLLQLTYVERYGFLPVLLMALLGGLGLYWLRSKLPSKVAPLAAAVSLISVPVFYLVGVADADASHDRTVDEFRAALSTMIPADAVYFSGTDLEMFSGVPVAGGKTRFPVFGGLRWMRERVVPLIDARIRPVPGSDSDFSLRPELAQAYEKGLEIVSSRSSMLDSIAKPQKRGMIWSLKKGAVPPPADVQVSRAVSLCPAIERMSQRWPPDSHFFSIYLNAWFAFAFDNAAEALAAVGKTEKAELASKISAAISKRLPIADLGDQCRKWGVLGR